MRTKHLKVNANDVTPEKLFCPVESEVVEEQGLNVPTKNKEHHF